MNDRHVFSARVHLLPREAGGMSGWIVPVDRTTGKAVAFGFPIGHAPEWHESQWEFDDPMIVPGTTFTGRFRLLQAERFDDLFDVGTSFDLFGLGTHGVGPIGTGTIHSKRTMAPDEPFTWPSKAPSVHPVEPNRSISAGLRALPNASQEVLDLATKLAIVPLLPSPPSPWLLSDREYALLEGVVLKGS